MSGEWTHPDDRIGVGRDEYAELVADRDTLRAVSEELLEARLLLGAVRRGLSARASKSLEEGAYWVRLDRVAARAVLEWRP